MGSITVGGTWVRLTADTDYIPGHTLPLYAGTKHLVIGWQGGRPVIATVTGDECMVKTGGWEQQHPL